MGKGVIRLLRTPLREGEPAYAISNVDQGLYVEGNKKGEKMPRTFRHAQVLEDGRLLWELPDTEINRNMVNSMLPQIPNPPFAYSVEFPEDHLEEDEEHEVQGEALHVPHADPQPAPPVLKRRGRKPKGSKGEKSAPGGK
jgi:hypothetical protein